MNDFHYASTLAEQLYGVQLKEDQFEEIALVAWNLIGNKKTRIYKYKSATTSIGDCEHAITLPCNVDILEAVTANFEEFQETSNINDRSKPGSYLTEQYIERNKHKADPLYIKGKFINYQQIGNQLIFNKPYKEVNILYQGILLDDNGLPQLSDKEALAIATYVAYVTKYKEGLIVNNQNIIGIANTLKQQWLIQCDQARTDQYLNQNDWNNILNVRVSWDRKQFNKTFKMFYG